MKDDDILTTDEVQHVRRNQDEEKIEVINGPEAEQGPFTGYSGTLNFPDPKSASPPNMRAAIKKIIEKDGPISRASVYRLYVEGCPHLQRVGRAIREVLNRAIGAMLRSGEITQEDELGNGSPEGQVLRLVGAPMVLVRPAGRRDLLEIPPSELRIVLERLNSSSESSLSDEILMRGILEHYGFTRLTAMRRGFLNKVIEIHRKRKESIEEQTQQR